MKQIEKLTIDSAERNWDMANVRDMLYALIDAHNTQAGEEVKYGCDLCQLTHKIEDCPKQDPIDVDQKLQELYMLGFQFGTKNTLMDPFLVVQKREELKDSIKSAIRQ